ncbi:hypothetical protein EB093_05210 [bacterium]|nr:hypothetical protein [bacterium]
MTLNRHVAGTSPIQSTQVPHCFGFALFHYLQHNFPDQLSELQLPGDPSAAFGEIQRTYEINRANGDFLFSFPKIDEMQSRLIPFRISLVASEHPILTPSLTKLPPQSFLFYYMPERSEEGHIVCINRIDDGQTVDIWDLNRGHKVTVPPHTLHHHLVKKMAKFFSYKNPDLDSGTITVQTILYRPTISDES